MNRVSWTPSVEGSSVAHRGRPADWAPIAIHCVPLVCVTLLLLLAGCADERTAVTQAGNQSAAAASFDELFALQASAQDRAVCATGTDAFIVGTWLRHGITDRLPDVIRTPDVVRAFADRNLRASDFDQVEVSEYYLRWVTDRELTQVSFVGDSSDARVPAAEVSMLLVRPPFGGPPQWVVEQQRFVTFCDEWPSASGS